MGILEDICGHFQGFTDKSARLFDIVRRCLWKWKSVTRWLHKIVMLNHSRYRPQKNNNYYLVSSSHFPIISTVFRVPRQREILLNSKLRQRRNQKFETDGILLEQLRVDEVEYVSRLQDDALSMLYLIFIPSPSIYKISGIWSANPTSLKFDLNHNFIG